MLKTTHGAAGNGNGCPRWPRMRGAGPGVQQRRRASPPRTAFRWNTEGAVIADVLEGGPRPWPSAAVQVRGRGWIPRRVLIDPAQRLRARNPHLASMEITEAAGRDGLATGAGPSWVFSLIPQDFPSARPLNARARRERGLTGTGWATRRDLRPGSGGPRVPRPFQVTPNRQVLDMFGHRGANWAPAVRCAGLPRAGGRRRYSTPPRSAPRAPAAGGGGEG